MERLHTRIGDREGCEIPRSYRRTVYHPRVIFDNMVLLTYSTIWYCYYWKSRSKPDHTLFSVSFLSSKIHRDFLTDYDVGRFSLPPRRNLCPNPRVLKVYGSCGTGFR